MQAIYKPLLSAEACVLVKFSAQRTLCNSSVRFPADTATRTLLVVRQARAGASETGGSKAVDYNVNKADRYRKHGSSPSMGFLIPAPIGTSQNGHVECQGDQFRVTRQHEQPV